MASQLLDRQKFKRKQKGLMDYLEEEGYVVRQSLPRPYARPWNRVKLTEDESDD